MSTFTALRSGNFWPIRILFVSVLIASAVAAFGGNAIHGQETYNWIGSGSDTEFFHFNSNWLQNQVPGHNDIAEIGFAYAIPITIQFENDHVLDELHILNSEFSFRGFNFLDDTATRLEVDRAKIEGDSKLTLLNGVNGRSFEMAGNQLELSTEMNVLQGTDIDFSDVIVGTFAASTQGLLTVSGEMNGKPSALHANNLKIADDGLGHVNVNGGAQVNVAHNTQIGLFTGSGELHISGNDLSTLPTRLTSGNLLVSSPGTLTVTGRSEVTLNNFATSINAGEQTQVNVTTPDAIVRVGSLFQINGGDVLFENGSRLVTNNSSISFSGSEPGALTVRSNNTDELTSWSNSGDVELAGFDVYSDDGGRMLIDGGVVEIGQTLKLFEFAEFTMSQSQLAPSILVVDTVDNSDGGQFNFDSGTLSVNWFDGDLDNFDGTLAPGDDVFGNAVGRTVVLGDFFQSANATLALDIGGYTPVAEYDLLEIGGFMIAGGQLQLNLENGFMPNASDEIVMASAANIIGSFANVENAGRLATADGSGSFRVNYGFASQFAANQIVLSDFEAGSFLLGDVNGDGSVDLLDVAPFVELLSSGGFNAAADINQDGNVDLLDVQPFVDLLTSS